MTKLPMAQSSPVWLVFFTYLKPILPRTRPVFFLNELDLSGPILVAHHQKTELGRFSPYVLVDNITYVYVDLKLYSTFTFKSISFGRIDLFTDLNLRGSLVRYISSQLYISHA